MRKLSMVLFVLLVFLINSNLFGQGYNFANAVSDTRVGDVKSVNGGYKAHYIVWGGEAPLFHANGGLTTQRGSIFDKLGIHLELVAGDVLGDQVRRYKSGEVPFLRVGFRQLGILSEACGADPRTRPVVFLQMTWSKGDHFVFSEKVGKLQNLKGTTLFIFKDGPHIGFVDDIFNTAKTDDKKAIGWSDVKVVWVDAIDGPNGPGAAFKAALRKDPNMKAAAVVVTPDMIDLTGGLSSIGNGREGTIMGARVGISTAEYTRSIADMIACRKDFYDANKSYVEKFVVGYLKACEEVVDMKKAWEQSGSDEFDAILTMFQDIYGSDIISDPADQAYGFIADAAFVGHPGQIVFFNETNNPNGFDAFQRSTLAMAKRLGYINKEYTFLKADFDYNASIFTSNIKNTKVEKRRKFKAEATEREINRLNTGEGLDESRIYDFTIPFAPNQEDFTDAQYGSEFKEAVNLMVKGQGAVLMVRGHSDPSWTLMCLVRSGLQKGILKKTGTKGNYKYYYNGREMSLTDTGGIIKLIQTGAFSNTDIAVDPQNAMSAAFDQGMARSQKVVQRIIAYARDTMGITLDPSQIRAVTAGITEPIVPKPRSVDDAQPNRRVEVILVRVKAEAQNPSDFDY